MGVLMMTADINTGMALDAEIARVVFQQTPQEMCWRFKHGRCDGATITRCGACGRNGHANCYGDGSGPVQLSCCSELPPYSTSIESAWLVVEEMREQSFSIRREFSHMMLVLVSRRKGLPEGECLASSEWWMFTEPEDICRAALLAMKASDAP